MKNLIMSIVLAFSWISTKSQAGNDSICSITVDSQSSAEPRTFTGMLTTGSYSYTLRVSESEFINISKLKTIYITSKTFKGRIYNLEPVGSVVFGYSTNGEPFVIVASRR
jgi:hypothetical protein